MNTTRYVGAACIALLALVLMAVGSANLESVAADQVTDGQVCRGDSCESPGVVLNPYGIAGKVPATGPGAVRVGKLGAPPCNCCSGGNVVGCDCSPCQQTVCALDPFCCNTAWDGQCDNEAADLCDCCDTGCTGLRLFWGPSCAAGPYGLDVDYEIYGGNLLGQFPVYTHEPIVCSTGGALNFPVQAKPKGEYYLVVPTDGDALDVGAEGSYGENSAPAQRPQLPGACRPQRLDECVFVTPCNCCSGGDGVGCDCDPCQATICNIDPFCCNTLWDNICNKEAADLCLCCTEGCGVTAPAASGGLTPMAVKQLSVAAKVVEPDALIEQHIQVFIDRSQPEDVRAASRDSLLQALSAGFDNLETGIDVVQALVGNVDVSFNRLLVDQLEDMRQEARDSGRRDLVRKVNELLNELE